MLKVENHFITIMGNEYIKNQMMINQRGDFKEADIHSRKGPSHRLIIYVLMTRGSGGKKTKKGETFNG